MKRNNLTRYITKVAVLIPVFLIASCEKFLDEKPRSFVSGKELYTNANNAKLAVTGLYDVLNAPSLQGQGNQPLWGRGMQYMTMLGDEITPFLDVISTPYLKDVASCAYNSETELVSDVWFSLYVGIYRANNIIKYVPAIDMDETLKKQYLAEARFFRGFFGLYLAWLYGGVPYPLDPDAGEKAPRLALSELYPLIEADLTFAYQNLENRNSKPGRVNKWTAAGFLLKMDTYLAAAKENNLGGVSFPLNSFSWVNASDRYTKALTISEDIYNNSGYKLVAPYYSTFYANTKSEQKEECLMVAQTGSGGIEEYFLFSYWTGPQGDVVLDGGNYGWIRPIGELANKFNTADLRFKQDFTGHSGGSTTKQAINGVEYYVPFPVNNIGNNVSFSKWRQSAPISRSQQGFPVWASNIDFPILRYADILLLYAEAAYKNGDEPKARDLLKELRTRAVTENGTVNNGLLTSLTTAYNNADFMQELLDERSRELCGEGWRRFDLIRFNKMASTLTALSSTTVSGNPYYFYNPQVATIKNNFTPNKIWFPVPKREIAVNPSLLPNNPGY